jgi:hypothetical protein
MGVPTSEVGYNSATAGRGVHEVHKGHVVALEIINIIKRLGFYNQSGECLPLDMDRVLIFFLLIFYFT